MSAHSSEHMFDVFGHLISELGITNKLSYFILDNVSTNDTAIKAIEDKLECNPIPEMTQFTLTGHRLRFFGYILNLIVKAILFKTSVNIDIGSKLDPAGERETIREERNIMRCWRTYGPLGRLHIIIIQIQHSPQRIQRFLVVQAAQNTESAQLLFDIVAEVIGRCNNIFTAEKILNVIADNDTGWNSTYLMIARGLKLQTYIDFFPSHTRELVGNRLLKWYWSTLKELHDLLQPFWDYIQEPQGTQFFSTTADF